MERARLGLMATLIAALAAAGGGGGVAANGDTGAPVTLKLGTYNGSNSPFAQSVTDFVANVAAMSNGDVTIEPQWEFKSDDPTASLSGYVFDSLKDGSLDMMIIGARMMDQVGITSFDALQTPFLIDSDALLNAVAADATITGPMLDGASKAGIVALAVLPEGLRHPTSFKAPFLKLADFAGKKLLTIPAVTSDAIITALGGEPSGLLGTDRSDAIASGAVDGIDFSYGWLLNGLFGTMGTTTGNITTYPTYNVLAVGQKAWEDLSDAQRDSLRKAATATVQQVMASSPTDAALAARYCAAGGNVVRADATGVASVAGAMSSVIAGLEADPLTKDLIARVAAIKAALPAAPSVAACQAPVSVDTPRPVGSPATLIPAGTYRATITTDELEASGWTHADALGWASVVTWQVEPDGKFEMHWAPSPGLPSGDQCSGTLTVVGDTVQFVFTKFQGAAPGGCYGVEDLQWQLADGKLLVTDVQSEGTAAFPPTPWFRTFFSVEPWLQVQ